MVDGVAEADLEVADFPAVDLAEVVATDYNGETCDPSEANTSYARYWHSDGQEQKISSFLSKSPLS